MRRRALAALLALLATACESPAGSARRAPAAAASRTPRRIVAMAPSLTETLFALGLGPRVVGVDDYSVWPAAVARLPRVGGLFNANLEKVVSLRPDLVVVLPSERDIAAKLERLGISTLTVPAESLDDVRRGFLLVARRCGVPQAGESAAATFNAELAPRPVGGAPRVMLSIDRQRGRLAAVLVAAHGTFLDELLARLGGVNVFADAASLYPQVGMEEVVARAPQVILELRTDTAPPAATAALQADWRQLPTLPAVRDGRIAVIAGDYVLVPGPRLPQLYRQMRLALLAPEGRAP
jgi:iron complex transport system substrate-binding protein